MRTRLIIDEDSVYEIDEECDEARKEQERKEQERKEQEWKNERKERKYAEIRNRRERIRGRK